MRDGGLWRIDLSDKKNIINRFLAVVQIMVLLVICVGCNTQDSDGQISVEEAKSSVVISFEDYDVTLSEYQLYLIQYLMMLQPDVDELSEEKCTEIKNTVVEEIRLEIIEYLLAQVTEGVEVTEEEFSKAREGATGYLDSFGVDFFEDYGIDKEVVEQLFVEQVYINALVEKGKKDMAEDLYKDYKEEYKDKNLHVVYYALFPTIELSSEEKKEQKDRAEELQKRVTAGESMEDLIKEYKIEEYSGEQQNFDGAYTDESLNALIADLEEGEISEVVEANGGYMVVRMDKKNDEEYKMAALQYNAAQEANKMITTMQSNWVNASGYASVKPNEDVLSKVDVKAICQAMKDKGLY